MAIPSRWKRNTPGPCCVDSLHSPLFPGYVEGIFNQILHKEEKQGGQLQYIDTLPEFQETLEVYDLSDSGSTGYPHTWTTNRREEGLVQERLDRFVASSSWKDSVYRAVVSVTNIDAWGSDHSPILS